jgi:hypothetical protein
MALANMSGGRGRRKRRKRRHELKTLKLRLRGCERLG